MILSDRIQNYTIVANSLACMSNSQLQDITSKGKARHTGIGGTSTQVEVEKIPVFLKKIPLAELELKPEHFMSTANLFNLPMCYQYGIGSTGFGAWRELAAHVMTTNWVLSGQCPNFPLLYGWRIINDSSNQTNSPSWGCTESYLTYWENNEDIKNRINNLSASEHSILLFLEYFPKNLLQQLKATVAHGTESRAVQYLKKLNQSFETVFKFMQENNFLHMDAHFRNILADEDTIYFSDFGLALSAQFSLSKRESNFLKDHQSYDQSSYSVNLLHGVLTSYVGEDNWDDTLRNYLTNKLSIKLPDKIQDILTSHTLTAEKMHRFYRGIQKDKSIPYCIKSQ